MIEDKAVTAMKHLIYNYGISQLLVYREQYDRYKCETLLNICINYANIYGLHNLGHYIFILIGIELRREFNA